MSQGSLRLRRSPASPGIRLHTLEAKAGKPGRRASSRELLEVARERAGQVLEISPADLVVSGMKKQNTIKATVATDEADRTLWAGAAACTTRPPCAPRASPTPTSSTPRSRPATTPGTAAWPGSSPVCAELCVHVPDGYMMLPGELGYAQAAFAKVSSLLAPHRR